MRWAAMKLHPAAPRLHSATPATAGAGSMAQFLDMAAALSFSDIPFSASQRAVWRL